MGWGEFALAFAAFFLTHCVKIRPPVRPWLRARLGKAGFGIAYSALSLGVRAWLIGAAEGTDHEDHRARPDRRRRDPRHDARPPQAPIVAACSSVIRSGAGCALSSMPPLAQLGPTQPCSGERWQRPRLPWWSSRGETSGWVETWPPTATEPTEAPTAGNIAENA